jgi:hypothetical protein
MTYLLFLIVRLLGRLLTGWRSDRGAKDLELSAPLDGAYQPPSRPREVHRRDVLGGLIHEYEGVAACGVQGFRPPTRAHSVGRARQHVNLLGFALMVNGLALLEHRHRRVELARAA